MTETAIETPAADINWQVAKFRLEMAYNECLNVASPPDKNLAVTISRIYAYGEAYPAARPLIVAMTGADRD